MAKNMLLEYLKKGKTELLELAMFIINKESEKELGYRFRKKETLAQIYHIRIQ